MMTFDDYSLCLASDEVIHADWDNIWRLGVIVFTRPEERVCKDIIAPSVNYLHEHTGEKVHFYFVGFYDEKIERYKEKALSGLFGDDTDWYFSPETFSKVQNKFENLTNNKWQYSGGTDLIVLPYRIRKGTFYIDAEKALDIKLSKLALQNNNYLTDEIIQIIVRQLKNGKDIDGVSNSRIMSGIKEGLKASLLDLLPNGLSKSFEVLEPFAVKNLT